LTDAVYVIQLSWSSSELYMYINVSVCQELVKHCGLLKRGLSLSRAPTVSEALAGNLPLCETSCERMFLSDFINCTARTSGARLATWASICYFCNSDESGDYLHTYYDVNGSIDATECDIWSSETFGWTPKQW